MEKTQIYKIKAKYCFFKEGVQTHLEINFLNGNITLLNQKDRIVFATENDSIPFIFKGSNPKLAKIVGEIIAEMAEFGGREIEKNKKIEKAERKKREREEDKLTPKQKEVVKKALKQ